MYDIGKCTTATLSHEIGDKVKILNFFLKADIVEIIGIPDAKFYEVKAENGRTWKQLQRTCFDIDE